MKKALVLYSGGLDSRLVVRILQKQNYNVEALYFKLPFGCGCTDSKKMENLKLTVVDVTKEPLLSEYLSILKKPKFGTGAGINPCIDCKIFMFKKAKEYADKHGHNIIATGEVPGQRPMSQTNSAQKENRQRNWIQNHETSSRCRILWTFKKKANGFSRKI